MKKLLLTSDGLTTPKLGERFLELVGKDPKDIRVLFVPTASDAKKDVPYLERKIAYFKQCNKIFTDLGVQQENLFWLNVNNILAAGDIYSYDAMFVCGGNTPFLLHEIRRTGFDQKILDFINAGKLFIGESAGSIIVGPNILMSLPFDENEIGLKDFTGLKLTEKIICPHYDTKGQGLADDGIVGENIVDKFDREHNCKAIRLKDGQAWEEINGAGKLVL